MNACARFLLLSHLVRFFTHLYFLKCSITHGILPTSSTQVQAYTIRTGQRKTKAPSSARGIAMPHMQTASEYMSNRVSPPAAKTPLKMKSALQKQYNVKQGFRHRKWLKTRRSGHFGVFPDVFLCVV